MRPSMLPDPKYEAFSQRDFYLDIVGAMIHSFSLDLKKRSKGRKAWSLALEFLVVSCGK
jgi:hypothetical protein